MDELYRALLSERFGTVADLAREARRLPPPREIARHRRVLTASMRSEREKTEIKAA